MARDRADKQQSPAIPPEILAAVRRIEIRTRRLVDEVFSGEYHSVFRGRGVEFREVREYVPGDDVRTIDWNVTARTGEPYVKRYVEERQLTLMLMADVSASQDFGSVSRFACGLIKKNIDPMIFRQPSHIGIERCHSIRTRGCGNTPRYRFTPFVGKLRKIPSQRVFDQRNLRRIDQPVGASNIVWQQLS